MIENTDILSANRLIFFVGVNTGYVSKGEIDERFIDFYRRRSSKKLHCAIVGNVVIPGGHGTNSNTPMISRSSKWAEVAGTIAARGSLPGIQLATVWKGYVGPRSFRSSFGRDAIERARDLIRGMRSEEIRSMLRALDDAAGLAVEAGFRHLQVHAAHGYTFSLLVDERINRNAKEVLKFLSEWSLRQSALGVETSIRFSLRTGDVIFDSAGRNKFHAQIAALPFDFLDVSSGFYEIDKQLIYPARPDVLLKRHSETIALAGRFPQRDFILSGRAMRNPSSNLPTNVHVGICRDLIANPDYLADKTRGCTNLGKCHYFSRGDNHVTCPHWLDRP